MMNSTDCAVHTSIMDIVSLGKAKVLDFIPSWIIYSMHAALFSIVFFLPPFHFKGHQCYLLVDEDFMILKFEPRAPQKKKKRGKKKGRTRNWRCESLIYLLIQLAMQSIKASIYVRPLDQS